MDELAKRILAIQMDGLTWKTEYKILPIAYGMNKLQCGAIVEDNKVACDDLFEKITCWEEEVQSVDIVSFQKV